MNLRWFRFRNKVTSEQVRAHAAEQGLSMMAAKNALEGVTDWKLQYCEDGDYIWRDVPCVEVSHGCDDRF